MAPQSTPPTASARRRVVTHEALSVAPEMLGLPLASPWRRGAAIAVDGLCCAVLANAPGVLFGVASAWVLLRASRPKQGHAGYFRRATRFSLRAVAAMVLFAVAVSLWGTASNRLNGSKGPEVVAANALTAGTGVTASGRSGIQLGVGVARFYGADEESEARAAATDMLRQLRGAGLTHSEARSGVREIAASVKNKPWLLTAVDQAIADDIAAEAADADAAPAPVESNPDSLFVAYAAALTAGDTATQQSLRSELASLLSTDTVSTLSGTIEGLERDRDQLREAVTALEEEAEAGPGIMAMLRTLSEDLGLGFGWFALYFTATTALWHGRTPGKRLFGIRVINLTGKPIGWWASFERFGGYAAGPATGLLGFLQIFWDDNRQAIHDKIALTAVIRDRPSAEERLES